MASLDHEGKPVITLVFHWPNANWSFISTLGWTSAEWGRDFWEIVENHGLPGVVTHSSNCECGACPPHPLDTAREGWTEDGGRDVSDEPERFGGECLHCKYVGPLDEDGVHHDVYVCGDGNAAVVNMYDSNNFQRPVSLINVIRFGRAGDIGTSGDPNRLARLWALLKDTEHVND